MTDYLDQEIAYTSNLWCSLVQLRAAKRRYDAATAEITAASQQLDVTQEAVKNVRENRIDELIAQGLAGCGCDSPDCPDCERYQAAIAWATGTGKGDCPDSQEDSAWATGIASAAECTFDEAVQSKETHRLCPVCRNGSIKEETIHPFENAFIDIVGKAVAAVTRGDDEQAAIQEALAALLGLIYHPTVGQAAEPTGRSYLVGVKSGINDLLEDLMAVVIQTANRWAEGDESVVVARQTARDALRNVLGDYLSYRPLAPSSPGYAFPLEANALVADIMEILDGVVVGVMSSFDGTVRHGGDSPSHNYEAGLRDDTQVMMFNLLADHRVTFGSRRAPEPDPDDDRRASEEAMAAQQAVVYESANRTLGPLHYLFLKHQEVASLEEYFAKGGRYAGILDWINEQPAGHLCSPEPEPVSDPGLEHYNLNGERVPPPANYHPAPPVNDPGLEPQDSWHPVPTHWVQPLELPPEPDAPPANPRLDGFIDAVMSIVDKAITAGAEATGPEDRQDAFARALETLIGLLYPPAGENPVPPEVVESQAWH